MASQHGAPPVFNNKVIAWIDHRLPIFSYLEKEYHTFPTPRNFNYFWNFGAIATVMLVLMIATGVVLATNYTPHVTMAFDSVERIMRDVPSGWPTGTMDRLYWGRVPVSDSCGSRRELNAWLRYTAAWCVAREARAWCCPMSTMVVSA